MVEEEAEYSSLEEYFLDCARYGYSLDYQVMKMN